MSCDYAVSAKVYGSDGSTLRVDLNDEAVGYVVLEPMIPPLPTWSRNRVAADDVDGSYRTSERLEDHDYPLLVDVTGSTWPEVETRLAALLDAVNAEADCFLETVIEGVTRRWSAERPSADLESVDLKNKSMTVRLTFLVQPSPTITTA